MLIGEVLRVLAALDDAGVRHWVEGGWGVDALAGSQQREHRDLDVDLMADDEPAALAALAGLGYVVETDQRPTRVELVLPGVGWVDVHPLQPGPTGVRQAKPDGAGWWDFPPDCFTTGSLDGVPVPTFTAATQRFFRTGYEPRGVDRLDLAVLDRLDGGAGESFPAQAGKLPLTS